MNPLKKLLRILLLMIAATQLAACSKTVQWEEEVPLNTGETIWVKRTVVYSPQGGAGNPFDIAYRPERGQTIEFKWHGSDYVYAGDAGIMLLAISPQSQPVLVAQAEAGAWESIHNYRCTIPFYVQFVPDSTGQRWTWPPQIDTWLFNLETNLLLAIPTPDQPKRRFTAVERRAANLPGLVQSPERMKIDPAYTGDLCKQKG